MESEAAYAYAQTTFWGETDKVFLLNAVNRKLFHAILKGS